MTNLILLPRLHNNIPSSHEIIRFEEGYDEQLLDAIDELAKEKGEIAKEGINCYLEVIERPSFWGAEQVHGYGKVLKDEWGGEIRSVRAKDLFEVVKQHAKHWKHRAIKAMLYHYPSDYRFYLYWTS